MSLFEVTLYTNEENFKNDIFSVQQIFSSAEEANEYAIKSTTNSIYKFYKIKEFLTGNKQDKDNSSIRGFIKKDKSLQIIAINLSEIISYLISCIMLISFLLPILTTILIPLIL